MSDSKKASAAKHPRVLVAEDEALIRFDLVELLNDEGYEVVGQAGDGEKAVELARELEPDLVVMDVKMPKMDGIAAAEIIASERIAPVVMLTAFSQRDLVEQAREAGAMAYVVKPFDASDVVPAIEIAMARFAEIRALDDEIEHRRAVGVALAQVAGQQAGDPLAVAREGRLVQPQLRGQGGHGLGCGVGTQQHLGGVAGQHLQHPEDHGRGAQQRGDQGQQALQDEPGHMMEMWLQGPSIMRL